jgi:guanylate kinase
LSDSHRGERRGNLLVLSAPSGAGKSSLVRRLVERVPHLAFSVSATTRAPRGGERDGVEYRFVDRAAFEAMIRGGELLEHAEVHGNLYGTPRDAVRRALERGDDVLLEIDVQGARQVLLHEPAAKLIFVLPPTREILEKRLRSRGLDAEDSIVRRLDEAAREVSAVDFYHHVVVNDDLDTALEELTSVVLALRQTPRCLERRVREIQSSFGVAPEQPGDCPP